MVKREITFTLVSRKISITRPTVHVLQVLFSSSLGPVGTVQNKRTLEKGVRVFPHSMSSEYKSYYPTFSLHTETIHSE